MNDEQIIEKLSAIFKKNLEVCDFNPKLSMEDVPEWDSLKHIQLIFDIENCFGIQINYEDVLDMTAISSIVRIIKKYVNEV